MIVSNSVSSDWISSKVKDFNADPIIIEKVIRALILVESIKRMNLSFIFKGGTTLMLLLKELKRFSIDIDILIQKKNQNIELILNRIIEETDFIKWEEHKRKTVFKIDKRHFKVFYKPTVKMKNQLGYILLDVVYESNPYVHIQKTKISHFLLNESGYPIQVWTPTLEALLGDKLTAYGPNTTGIPLSKPMEIMKQIYDIAGIFDNVLTIHKVNQNFTSVAKRELIYIGFDKNAIKLIFDDIICTSHNFCIYGRINRDDYDAMRTGLSRLKSFIYGKPFREREAQCAIAKIVYIVKLFQENSSFIERFNREVDMNSWIISNNHFSGLNKLKKHNLEAFYYWYKSIQKS